MAPTETLVGKHVTAEKKIQFTADFVGHTGMMDLEGEDSNNGDKDGKDDDEEEQGIDNHDIAVDENE